jgi:hypothetical protein
MPPVVTLAGNAVVSRVQGAYYLATGIWPVLNRRSFEAVSGKKRDFWLVRTVGAITAAAGLSITIASRRNESTAEMAALKLGTALGFAAIDLTYGLRRCISAVYLLDGGVQTMFIAAHVLLRDERGKSDEQPAS